MPRITEAMDNSFYAGTPRMMRKDLVFSREESPSRQCHAPTLVDTPSGLVVAWFGGRIEGAPDSGIWLARQTAAGWSKPVAVIAGPSGLPNGCSNDWHGHTAPHPCWNPVLFRPREGPLFLFYKAGRGPRLWQGWLTASSDDGKTWSAPRPLGVGPLGPLLGPTKNKPVQRPDGLILCPGSTEARGWRVHIEATRDLEQWEIFGPIDDPLKLGAIQPTLLFLPDGRLRALCRTRAGVIARGDSRDGGETWGPLAPTVLKNPNSGIDAVALNDGRFLLIHNDSKRTRSPLVAALSEDGERWRTIFLLEQGPGEYSYPAVVQDADGQVHVVYSRRRREIGYVKICIGL